ncbi:MAG: TonB-dependent receptor [Myxococcota bacterium]
MKYGAGALCLGLVLLSSHPGAAQDLVPPQVETPVEATLPPGTSPPTERTAIVLQIVIDSTGTVTGAEVVEGVDPVLDQAASEALLRFRFRPATQNGEPIPSQVLYRYVFRPPPPEPVPPPEETEPEVDDPPPSRAGEPSAEEEITEPPPPPDTSADDDAGFAAAAVVEYDPEGVLERTAEAVNLVDTRELQGRALNLGDVLSRQQGVIIRRRGGRGSQSSLALGGLDGDQVRTFVDGIPLEAAGYPFGVPDIQTNGFEGVEIHRGIVPIRFGLDSLGGVVNLRTDSRERHTFLAGSYQVGSFGTVTTTAQARVFHEASGFTAGIRGFLDHSDNDYMIDVEVPDARGRLSPARVRRFHDGYSAVGAGVDVGLVDQSWARRIRLTLYGTGYDKDLQHNVVMTVPYGEVESRERVYGGTLRYDVDLGEDVELGLVTNVSTRRTDFVDLGEFVYDWFGNRIRERRIPGEISSQPTDATFRSWSTFNRLSLRWDMADGHVLDAAISPSFTTRTGENRLLQSPEQRDPLSARQDLLKMVVGLSYQADLFDDLLQSIVFAKYYFYQSDVEEVLPGGIFRPLSETQHLPGFGGGLRLSATDWLWLKASYEFTARLPNPDEVFGNGVLIVPNLELQPERSHNINVGVQVDLDEDETETGEWQGEVYLVTRFPRDLIILLGNEQSQSYQNVFGARGLSLEAQLRWTSPGDWVSLQGNLTYNDLRNASTEGAFGDFDGDRIPHRPFFDWNVSGSFRIPEIFSRHDSLTLGGDLYYVQEFFRSWESQGIRAFKQTVPTQIVVGAYVSYGYDWPLEMTVTLEAQNLTDELAFDFFGVQRPGRAFYLKLAGEL